MRILLLATDAYGGHGGIALFNREFVAALTMHSDCEEVVVVPRVIGTDVGDIPPRVRFFADAARGNGAYLRAIAALRKQSFDLVICGHVNLLPVAAALDAHPLLITHGIEVWKPLESPLSRRLLHRSRGIVSVSAVTRDRLVGWSGYKGPTFVLPNAVHLEQYGIREKRPDLIERYQIEGKRVLLTVGRLSAEERYKGFDEVMEALPELPEDVVYLIAGGGNDFPRLQQKAMQLGITDRVRFTGLFDESDKPDIYNLADVYVMPSRGEGFGFVFLEAMACGVPVIGSRLDGGREALLDGKLGTLADPASPEAICNAILETLTRDERRIPAGLHYFQFSRFVARVSDIIEAVEK
ncbi:MAG TPA: glycosyltransferase family 4 protein [Thermoanaerobaculia bacterium]